MSSMNDDLGPMPPWLRKSYTTISCQQATTLITKCGVRATVPSPSDTLIQLNGGSFLLLEACRDEDGQVQLGYHFLPWRVFRDRRAKQYGLTKEVSHAGSHGTRNRRHAPNRVA